MMNNTNNGNRNTALETAIANIIENCKNVVKLAELETLAQGTSCEGDYVCCSVNITEQLQAAKSEVERLETVIAECEAAKAKTEEASRKEKEAEQEFLNSLTFPGKEVLSYLEGLKTLAKGDQLTMVEAIIKTFVKYDSKQELIFTANMAAYVAILVREEKKEVIDLLESITIKVYDIARNNKGSAGGRVEGLDRILRAVQDVY